jgi:predicted N-formylglutamate amidohydrolase
MHKVLRPGAAGPFVIFCDHASNHIPDELDGLGLPDSELTRHIAWDIGAAAITEELSKRFDSPAILCGTSRLVIDCNRQLNALDLIPEVSDATPIPGNRNLDERAREQRIAKWFTPYHAAIEEILVAREERGIGSIALSIHSMTASLAGIARPWQIALSSYTDRSLVDPLLTALRRPGDVTVGDNQPYDLDPAVDYSTPFHALRRNLRHLQVEFRQDEVADEPGQSRWAARFATALSVIL